MESLEFGGKFLGTKHSLTCLTNSKARVMMTCLQLFGRDDNNGLAKTVGDRALLCRKATKLLLMAMATPEVEAKRGADRCCRGEDEE